MLLTDEPSNRRALQMSTSTASAGASILDRFITHALVYACKKPGQSVQTQPCSKDVKTQNLNPAPQQNSQDKKSVLGR